MCLDYEFSVSFKAKIWPLIIGSPGLVVMGGDSWSKDCEFKFQHHILDGHFSHLFVVKLVMCV